MSAITLAVLVLVRIILPLGILLALGEWIRQREARYWLPK